MSIQGLFDIGKRGVFSSQMALNVVSHNMANVNTPNYSRQEVVLNTPNPGKIGTAYMGRGVNLDGIKRNYDGFINKQLLGQTQTYGKSTTLSDGLGQVEQIFNEAAGSGLSKPLTEFFAAWNGVSNNPEDIPQRNVLMQKSAALVDTAKQMENSLENIIRTTNFDLKDTANRINSLTKDIADLNTRIKTAGGINGANDLLDNRDRMLTELGTLTEFTSTEDAHGQITVTIGRQNLVDHSIARQIEVKTDTNLDVHYAVDGQNFDQYIKKGRVGGLIELRDTIRTKAIEPLRSLMGSIVDNINNQHQQGYGLDGVNGRDFFTPPNSTDDPANLIKNLSVAITDPTQIAASLPTAGIGSKFSNFVTNPGETVNFNVNGIALSFTGTGTAAGDATAFYNALQTEKTANGTLSGFTFSDNGTGTVSVGLTNATVAPEAFSVTGWSGSDVTSNTSVAVTPDAGTNISATRLNDNAAGTSTASTSTTLSLDKGVPGNNLNALEILKFQSSSVMINAQGGSFAQHYSTMVSSVGTMAGASTDTNKFDKTLLDDLKQRRDDVSSVSIDEEAIDMLRYQRAFQASARIISVTDELLKTVLEMV